jgi:hypothetical protein
MVVGVDCFPDNIVEIDWFPGDNCVGSVVRKDVNHVVAVVDTNVFSEKDNVVELVVGNAVELDVANQLSVDNAVESDVANQLSVDNAVELDVASVVVSVDNGVEID